MKVDYLKKHLSSSSDFIFCLHWFLIIRLWNEVNEKWKHLLIYDNTHEFLNCIWLVVSVISHTLKLGQIQQSPLAVPPPIFLGSEGPKAVTDQRHSWLNPIYRTVQDGVADNLITGLFTDCLAAHAYATRLLRNNRVNTRLHSSAWCSQIIARRFRTGGCEVHRIFHHTITAKCICKHIFQH